MTWVFVLIAFTASSITAKEPTCPAGRPACFKMMTAASRSGWPKGPERLVCYEIPRRKPPQ